MSSRSMDFMNMNNSENMGILLDKCCFNHCKKLVQCKFNTVKGHKFLFEESCDYFQIQKKPI